MAEAEQANEDTFHYTNAAPQAAKFNQGIALWLGIEDYLQEHAAQYRSRVVVFTGPVFSPADPVYRGVDIPLRFFKVAAFIHQGELAATGYVVDQTPQLADLPDVARPGAVEDAPPLGPFRTFQAPVRDIAELTGLDLHQLIAADRMPISATLGTVRVGSTWRLLGDAEDLDLDFDGPAPFGSFRVIHWRGVGGNETTPVTQDFDGLGSEPAAEAPSTPTGQHLHAVKDQKVLAEAFSRVFHRSSGLSGGWVQDN
ncbi:DNA/RNA non-specific endonuclease [Arthrobacter sp. ISL-72]|uniref:DNA/RNA non-specific endonuclease n=1 Tax=Arthrobacter sp. ISL-72 TaxID=2819114 RepID=UPI00288BBA21|nr:DNA/RNA non-specific endonuclease [Arthrobacter sp. ISL-72]